jgi:alkylation response protein AidB-like acyl-CoA dehydrogenase
VIAYKFLRPDGTSVFTRYTWPLPDDGPGPWVDAEVDPCRSGIHACRRADLPLWLGRSLYEIELEGEVREEATKVVAGRARLLRRIDAWDESTRDEYTRMCADRAHELARAADLAGWDAVVEPSVPEGPALLGFVAARIAEKISGADAYHAERRHQADWLADRLGL